MNGNRKSRRMQRRRGFTLLEILLVVGLLALLAAFVVPNLIGSAETANKKLAQAAIGSNGPIAQALKMFSFHVGRYPETLKELFDKPDDEEEAGKWAGPYLEDAEGLKDPWGHEYKYVSPGTHNEDKFDLWSMGKDAKDGTEDDIKNWKDDR